MEQRVRREAWLANFRRTFGYLRPHARRLAVGLLLAVGVSLFYTFSISSVIPLLKLMFAEHETLSAWVTRMEAERRLGAAIDAPMQDDAAGFVVGALRRGSPAGHALRPSDRVAAIAGEAPGACELLRRVARASDSVIRDVRVVSQDGRTRTIDALPLRPCPLWQRLLDPVVALLPAGADARSRLTTLGWIMAALVVASLLGSFCRFVHEGLVASAVQGAMHDLRTALGARTLRLPLDWHTRHPPGDAISRFANDISRIEIGQTTLLGKAVGEPLKAAGVLALTILIDYRMLLIAAAGVPLAALVIRGFGRRVKSAQRRASQSWGRLLDHLAERLAGIRVVKAFGMEAAETRRFRAEGRQLTRAQIHVEVLDAATKPVLETLGMIGVAAFVLYGGALVFHRQMEVHWFFGAVACMVGTFDPIRKLGNVNNRVQAAEAAAARVFQLMDLPVEDDAPAPARPPATVARAEAAEGAELPAFQREIRFERVTFAYPSNPTAPVLSDVSLRVAKGRMLALVGPNGSGKTTLISLLLRFFQPQSGRILIDDVDIARVSLRSLRAQIGLVTQDSVVFSDTVRANIAYGANGVSDADVFRAARMAHADEFIRDLRWVENGQVRSGYDAFISGRTLSGGQKQRIAIARAILRDPPILVLDEATSQIDADSERRIQEALDEITAGRTTIVIAHRFTTIARADQVVVLNEGRVVGAGTHAELMNACPLYVTLYQTQFAGA